MHARKFSKLADGYADSSSSRAMEDDDKHIDRSNKRFGADYCYSDSPASYSLSPARYSAKVSHSVRSLERDRKSDDSRHSSHTFTREMRSKDQKQQDHKAEVHRLAENICGDWSEHVSSSGKRYYYNCKTEVSQWEKPKDWTDFFTLPCGRNSRSNSKLLSKDKHSDVDPPVDKDTTPHHSDCDDCPHVQKSVNTFESSETSASFATDEMDDQPATQAVILVADNVKILDSAVSAVSHFDTDDGRLISVNSDSSPQRHNHQNTMCVNTSGVYGLVQSTETMSMPFRHNGASALSGHQVADGEDMDISPGSTPTEESLLEKKMNTSSLHNAFLVTSMSPAARASDPRTPLIHQMTPNSTFLSTLAALQQALRQVTVEKSTAPGNSSSKSVPSSVLNLLAALPSLICQLRSAEHTTSSSTSSTAATTTTSSSAAGSHQADQQQLTQNVIHMLQKLQQVLVAQQQQQQQRQLQELLLQLLTVQKHGTIGGQSSPASSPKQFETDALAADENKMESPYSPPDSDGTPLGSPENKPSAESTASLNLNDVPKESETPECDDHDSSSLRPSSQSPKRPDTASPAVASSTVSNLVFVPGCLQSSILVGTSQLAAAAVNRKQYDSAGLTPTLTNYVNSQLVDHVTGWHTDVADKQANCYNEESHSLSSLHCTQVAVDLKRARSLVRINEIQSTLHEQRVMLIRQQTKDLENMRTGLSFYAVVPSGT